MSYRVLEIQCHIIICIGEKLLYVMLSIETDSLYLYFELCVNGFIRPIFIHVIHECSFYLYRWEAHTGDHSTDDLRGVTSGPPDCHRLTCRQTSSAARSVKTLVISDCQSSRIIDFKSTYI